MKKNQCLTAILLLTVLSFKGAAQSKEPEHSFGFGLQISEYQQDFGIGVNLTSPTLAKGKIALRVKWNQMFYQYAKNNTTLWVPYSNVAFGIAGISKKMNNGVNLYGEGGAVGLLPSNEFSSEQFVFGGYGLFGFEFLSDETNGYFIEIGGIGSGAKADKIPFQPIYSNGLIISVGFRFYRKSGSYR